MDSERPPELDARVRAVQDDALRLDVRVWGVHRAVDRLRDERATLLESIRALRASEESLGGQEERLSRAYESTRLAVLDEVRVLRGDVVALDRARDDFLAELPRYLTSAAVDDSVAQELAHMAELRDRVSADLDRIERELAACVVTEEEPSAAPAARAGMRTPPAVASPAPRAAHGTGEIAGLIERWRVMRKELADQRTHAGHWRDITRQMDAPAPARVTELLAVQGGAVPAAGPGDRFVPTGPPETFIFDGGAVGAEVGRRLLPLGYLVTVAPPTGDLERVVGRRRVTSAAVNLAIPNGWGTARRLRASHCVPDARLFGYALAPEARSGLWIGMMDFLFLSSDEPNAVPLVRHLAGAAKRAIAITSDPDGLEGLYDELSRSGIAVTMAVDAAEVREVGPAARPQVALVHLAPRCFGVFDGIAALFDDPRTREIPLLFVLDPAAEPRDVAFFSAGLRTLADGHPQDVTQLVSLLSFNLKLNTHRPAA